MSAEEEDHNSSANSHRRHHHSRAKRPRRGKGFPPKWLAVLREFMKSKAVSAEELHEIAADAGLDRNFPLGKIKETMSRLDQFAAEHKDDDNGHGSDSDTGFTLTIHGSFKFGGGWNKLMKSFAKAKGVTPKELQEQCAALGYSIPKAKKAQRWCGAEAEDNDDDEEEDV